MMNPDILTSLFAPQANEGKFYGVTIGIVTNNKYDEEYGIAGAVKVRFPYISDTDESYWARVLTPMGGKERGIYFLPEVDDEVLVAFEQGSLDHPYVLGSLWNGVDKSPAVNDDGKNNIRMIKSRSGHQIVLDDTDGKEAIIIADKTGKNGLIIASEDGSFTISCEGDMTIQTKGKLSVSCNGLDLTSDADAKLKASKFTLDGDVEMTKAATVKGNATIKGNADISGNVTVG